MSDNETKSRITAIKNAEEDFLDKISRWNKLVPIVEKSRENHEWLENQMMNEPEILNDNTDEEFRDLVEANYATLPVMLDIPGPSENLEVYFSTSGSSSTDPYYRYIGNMENRFSGNITVLNWANDARSSYYELHELHEVSKEVNKRLNKIDSRLAELHTQATNEALSSALGIENTIAAASTLRELLDQFKGWLINKCRGGKGTKYNRIAEYLGLDSDLTKLAIKDSQRSYDQLHGELSQISHSRQIVPGDHMLQLLHDVENHIHNVTNALDPKKIGINLIID